MLPNTYLAHIINGECRKEQFNELKFLFILNTENNGTQTSLKVIGL